MYIDGEHAPLVLYMKGIQIRGHHKSLMFPAIPGDLQDIDFLGCGLGGSLREGDRQDAVLEGRFDFLFLQ